MVKRAEEYSDAELYEILTSKDKRASDIAFAEIYARHSARLYAYCRKFLGNNQDAEDVFQETFIRFHNNVDKQRAMTNIPAYLLVIARNLCLNHKRNEVKMASFEDYMYPDVDDEASLQEVKDLLQMALTKLNDDYREIFILREYDGLDYTEISQILNEPVVNIKVKVHRAKQKIRQILAPYFSEQKLKKKLTN